ncbi:MAG TPA: hypothetical protein VGK99_07230 [Acidobacteriota bacterium]|jgi:hypothetical protein
MNFYFALFFLFSAIIVITLLVAVYFWAMNDESAGEKLNRQDRPERQDSAKGPADN